MGVRPGDHAALVFLYRELLPFMIAWRKVRNQWFVWLDVASRYLGDFAAALAGLGIGGPLVGALAHPGKPTDNFLTQLKEQLGPTWFYIGVGAIVAWIILRLVAQNENVAQRATLAKQFALDNEGAYARLCQGLRTRTPQGAILEVYQSTMRRVQIAMTKEIWPFRTYRSPPEAYQPELDRLIDEIRDSYRENWDPLPPGQEF